jgi:hypothetical protein
MVRSPNLALLTVYREGCSAVFVWRNAWTAREGGSSPWVRLTYPGPGQDFYERPLCVC